MTVMPSTNLQADLFSDPQPPAIPAHLPLGNRTETRARECEDLAAIARRSSGPDAEPLAMSFEAEAREIRDESARNLQAAIASGGDPNTALRDLATAQRKLWEARDERRRI